MEVLFISPANGAREKYSCPLNLNHPVLMRSHRFADWIRFADGMSVKLRCDREALEGWWSVVSTRNAGTIRQYRQTVCEAFK